MRLLGCVSQCQDHLLPSQHPQELSQPGRQSCNTPTRVEAPAVQSDPQLTTELVRVPRVPEVYQRCHSLAGVLRLRLSSILLQLTQRGEERDAGYRPGQQSEGAWNEYMELARMALPHSRRSSEAFDVLAGIKDLWK
jgi:hypothetical protein